MSEEEIKAELRKIRELIEGNPWDRTKEPGILGRLDTIEHAMWGPPNRPNGIVGMVKEMRVTTRTMIVGLVVAGGGVVLSQWLG